MLKLYDQNKNPLGYIMKYCDDLCIESDLSNGDKSLSFTYLAKNPKDIKNEYYIETKDDRYVVKEVGVSSDGFPEFKCQLDLEDLEADMFENFSAMNCTLEDAANLALAGTGWTVNTEITKLRSVATMKATPLTILGKIRDAWMCEIQYDNKNKIVYFKNKLGEDKGVYFTRSLNLRKVELTSDSYDYYTRIIPIGADGLRITDVNGGKKYVENYQYSNKVRTLIWEDSSYEDAMALLEDAEKKLEDLSKPKKSYSADVVDLAKQNPNYSILSYSLGDTVLLLDERTGIKDKQRIVRLTEYPRKPEKNSCELSNTTLTFEEQQERIQAAADAVENITRADGTVNGVYVHGVEADGIVGIEVTINNSEAVSNINNQVSGIQTKIDVVNGELAIAAAKIGTLETTALTATTADLRYATIDRADILEGYVHNLEVDYGNFKTLTADEFAAKTAEIEKLSGDFASFKVGEFEILKSRQAEFEVVTANKFTAQTAEIQKVSGELASFKTGEFEELRSKQADFEEATANNFTATNGQIEHLSGEFASYKTTMSQELIAAKGWMLEGSIGNAQISSIDATKIKSGIIDTSLLNVKGSGGKLQIIDNTMQISDSNRVRVQIGKDASNDYSMSVWDQNGLLIWDALGATENTIQRKIIRDKMVAEDAAIQALKIDFQSFETALTNQGVTISGTVIQVGDKSLNVELSEQKQYVDDSIDNLEIGGRNIATKTNLGVDGWSWGMQTGGAIRESVVEDGINCCKLIKDDVEQSGWGFIFYKNIGRSKYKPNAVYTVSVEVKSNLVNVITFNGLMRTDGKSKMLIDNFVRDRNISSTWTKVSWVVTTRDVLPEATDQGVYFKVSSANSLPGMWYMFRNLKIEEGNKATDWTPAPEDTQTQIDEHAETLSDHSTKISANEKAINLRVTSQEYESYKSTVNGELASHNSRLNTAESGIDILQDKISLKVEQTDIIKAIDDLEIGGRNYIHYGKGDVKKGFFKNFYMSSDGYLYFTLTSKKTHVAISLRDGFLLKCRDYIVGSKVTISYDFMYTEWNFPEGTDHIELWIGQRYTKQSISGGDTTGQWRLVTQHNLPVVGKNGCELNKWVHVEYTFTIPEQAAEGIGDEDSIKLYNSNPDIAASISFRIKNVKIEYGNKATDWTPAPEDVDSAISNVDAKFANYSTTTQMQTAIDASRNSILLSVSETYSTKTEYSTLLGQVSNLETWKSQASQLITKDGIISTVGNYYAYTDDLNAATSRITAAETQIKQHADSITSIVEDGGVISLINQTAGSVKIDAAKINLSGYVTLTDLSTKGKTTIVGDNITSGTITGVTFKGVTGDFTGTVTADTGKMGFLTLTDNVIYGDNIYIYAGDSLNGANISMSGSIENPGVSSLYMASGMVVDDTDYNTNASLRIQPLSKGVTLTMFNSTGMTLEIEAATGDIRTYGNIYVSDEIVSTYPNALRMANGTYGAILRNDGGYTYFLLTNSGVAKTGSWNSLRPFTITNSNGHVSIGNGLNVEGGLTTDAILNMGSASKTGTERQIKFQVTSGTYTHNSYIYGGNSSSTTAIGCWDGKNSRGVWAYNDAYNTLEVNASLIPKGGLELYGVYPVMDFHYNNSSTDYTSRICEYSSGVLNVNGVTFTLSTSSISAAKGTFHGTYASTLGSRYGNQALEIRENGLVGSAQSDIGYAPGIGFHWSGRVAASLILHSDGGFRFLNQAYNDFSPVFVGTLYLGGAPYGKIYCNTSYGLFINPMGSGAVYLGYDNRCLVPPTGDAAIRGNGDATYDCGHTSYLWKTVYSKNGVKTTSDEREKDIMSLELSELSDYFMSIKPIAFRWKYGNDKKIHLGVGAQTTERKMIEAGYNPSLFDMIQHDDLEVVSDSGLRDRYGINYQDLNILTMMQTQKNGNDIIALKEWKLTTDIELAVFNQRQDTQEARIRDLEQQLTNALIKIEQLEARIAA